MVSRTTLVNLVILAVVGVGPLGAWAVPLGGSDTPRAPAPPGSPLGQMLNTGYDALGRGDFARATTSFSDAAKQDPKSALPYLGLAEVARLQNRPGAVEEWVKKAIATDPKSQEALRAWGRYQFTQGKFADAETTFKKAISLDVKSPGAHIDLGENYLNGTKQPGAAAEAYRTAIKLQPDHPGAHMGLAAALAAQGQTAPAVAEYEKAAKLQPGSPLPHHMLGRLYAANGKTDEALAALDRAVKTNATYLPALLDRGDIHIAKNDLSRAIADYQAVLKVAPKLAAAHFKMGMAYQSKSKWQDAESAYLATIDADPKMFGAYNNLAWMAANRKEKLDDALRWIKKAIEIAPQVTTLYDTLGWVHRARGEKELAVAALEKAAASKPPRAEYYYRLGLAYIDVTKTKEAVASFRKALEISQNFPEAADARRQIQTLGATNRK